MKTQRLSVGERLPHRRTIWNSFSNVLSCTEQ
jgi:hypothetical protein